MKVNYRYKINWELGALIKLIIKEAMHIIRALSELWVFQEKVDMKVSAFSFNSSLLIFGYL